MSTGSGKGDAHAERPPRRRRESNASIWSVPESPKERHRSRRDTETSSRKEERTPEEQEERRKRKEARREAKIAAAEAMMSGAATTGPASAEEELALDKSRRRHRGERKDSGAGETSPKTERPKLVTARSENKRPLLLNINKESSYSSRPAAYRKDSSRQHRSSEEKEASRAKREERRMREDERALEDKEKRQAMREERRALRARGEGTPKPAEPDSPTRPKGRERTRSSRSTRLDATNGGREPAPSGGKIKNMAISGWKRLLAI